MSAKDLALGVALGLAALLLILVVAASGRGGDGGGRGDSGYCTDEYGRVTQECADVLEWEP